MLLYNGLAVADVVSPPQLQVFGNTMLLDAQGKEIGFRAKQPLLVLSLLAHNMGMPVLRADLASVVWQSSFEKSGRESLRNALSILRKVLPEGALQTDTATVLLSPGFVTLQEFNSKSYQGDFMPEFHQDWVLDRRLRFRTEAVNAQLESAGTANTHKEKLAYAERACEIDPRSSKAVRLRDQILRDMGDVEVAIEHQSQYRRRIMREFGTLPGQQPSLSSDQAHPLLTSARWTLDHEPNRALSMIAATANQWQYLPIDSSRAILSEALQHKNSASESEYLAAYGQYAFLSAMSGSQTEFVQAEIELERCASANEFTAAARMGRALSYNRLSRGSFDEARKFAQRASEYAHKSGDKSVAAQSDLDNSVILLHSGRLRESRALYKAIRKDVFDHCTAEHIASYLIIECEDLVDRGKLDDALDAIDFSRRTYDAYGKTRMEPWILMSEAYLNVHIGDFQVAKEKLEQCLELSAATGGQAAIAMANERLANVNCEMKEYVAAVESLARAKKMRSLVGSVRSVAEVKQVRPVRRLITQNLHERDIARAYYKVLESA